MKITRTKTNIKTSRITVTVPQHVYDVFKRLSELQSASMSSVVSEILCSVYDPLVRTVALLDAAESAPKEVRDGLLSAFSRIEQEAVLSSGNLLGQMDWMAEKLGGSGHDFNPRIVTRGSGFDNSLKNNESTKIIPSPISSLENHYMNLKTGAVDTESGWHYLDENGRLVSAVERGEVVQVVKDDLGNWVGVDHGQI